jgi:hypothetical protein
MTAESPLDHDAPAIWQTQPSDAPGPSLEDLRRRATQFERQIARRNAREYVATAAAAACFVVIFWRSSDALERLGAALVVGGLLYLVWQLRSRGAPLQLPAELGQTTGLDFLRRDLARQRDLLRGVWRWYLGPPLPGMAVLLIAAARATSGTPGALWPIGVAAAMVTLVFAAIWSVNLRAANALQARIDELDRSAN